jgi:hypothetical protein
MEEVVLSPGQVCGWTPKVLHAGVCQCVDRALPTHWLRVVVGCHEERRLQVKTQCVMIIPSHSHMKNVVASSMCEVELDYPSRLSQDPEHRLGNGLAIPQAKGSYP